MSAAFQSLPLQAGSGSSPQPVYASQLSLAMNLAEVSITVGQVRQLIDPQSGQPATQAGVEWILSLLLSAPVARQLNTMLTTVLDEYEKKFGVIPRDASLDLLLTTPGRPRTRRELCQGRRQELLRSQ